MIEKRKDYITWDAYFMGIALLSAKRSKDPSTQVGACIVNDEHKILTMGYNGMPIGIDDNEMEWSREGDFLNTKYPYVCHAELNAILNSGGTSLKDSTLYVTLFPCNECAKAIIQSGIRHIVYLEDKYPKSDTTIAAKKMFNMVEIDYRQYKQSGKEIVISL